MGGAAGHPRNLKGSTRSNCGVDQEVCIWQGYRPGATALRRGPQSKPARQFLVYPRTSSRSNVPIWLESRETGGKELSRSFPPTPRASGKYPGSAGIIGMDQNLGRLGPTPTLLLGGSSGPAPEFGALFPPPLLTPDAAATVFRAA